MQKRRCPNLNHGISNPPVRHCPECGEIVNNGIHLGTCSPRKHAIERWNRNRFCRECGEQVLK
jgi:hypothetical protein